MTGGSKQNNKSHKNSAKFPINSKKVALPKLVKKKIVDNSRDLRILQKQQYKELSIKRNVESDHAQRGNNNNAPLLCGIFPLFDFNDIDLILSLLKKTDTDAKITKIDNEQNFETFKSIDFTMNSKKFRKNFSFITCRKFRDRFDYLDLAKVVDWALFILPNDFEELLGDYTEDLIASLIGQGLPSSCFCILNEPGVKMKSLEKSFESIVKLSLGDSKITSLTNLNDANKLMRHLAQNCKPSFISSSKNNVCSKSLHKKKGYFVVEQIAHDATLNKLKIRGCMRGYGMDLDTTKMMHLTEIGDFPLEAIAWVSPEESNKLTIHSQTKNWISKELYVTPLKPLIENIVGESDDESENEDMEEIEESSYDEEISDIDSEDSENANDDKMSFASTAHTGYSIAQIQKFRESREDSMFPDEIEIDCTLQAREKLKKYRGLVGFKTSTWPINEHIPLCYANIHYFRNYKHDRNRQSNNLDSIDRGTSDNFVKPGSKFEIILENFNEESYQKIRNILKSNLSRHIICSNLFRFEEKISILHFNERRLSSVDDSAVSELAKNNVSTDMTIELGEDSTSGICDTDVVLAPVAEPIESKESMLFQVGFRRFTATPIYSEFTANSDQKGSAGKSKYCKFMELKRNVVATLYGPVTYGPVPTLQFRIRQTDLGCDEVGPPYIAELVATGSLLSIDPTRPIIKRIMLSGQIYKVNKRSVMVRYMFFNTEDIEHFKEVPLHTKNGKKGRIIKSSGTHGYMKCYFNKPLSQAEIVLMPLYKRVYPKFTVQNMYDHIPDSENVENNQNNDMDTMDSIF